jgi:Flp pilus assembly CpaF family ATPase
MSDENSPWAATLPNLVSNALRATPEVIIVGEARRPEEFSQMLRAMRTGHKLLGTYHADDEADGVKRYATELSSEGGSTYTESLRLVADTLDIVVSQFRFPDGRRRVMGISEVAGVDEKGNVVMNPLFKFIMSGETRINEHGLEDVLGEFKQVGTVSERTKTSFFKSGIGMDKLREFTEITEDLS